MSARWEPGVYATRELRRGEYTIHQEARRAYDSGRWSLVSQRIREDDLVASRVARSAKSGNLRVLADRHIAELEKEIDQ